MSLYNNKNYTVIINEVSQKYVVINTGTGIKEFETEMLPDALSVAYKLDFLVNQFYREERERKIEEDRASKEIQEKSEFLEKILGHDPREFNDGEL